MPSEDPAHHEIVLTGELECADRHDTVWYSQGGEARWAAHKDAPCSHSFVSGERPVLFSMCQVWLGAEGEGTPGCEVMQVALSS